MTYTKDIARRVKGGERVVRNGSSGLVRVDLIEERMKVVGIKSWRELARRLDLSPSYLGDIKSKRTQPSLSTLQSLAQELQTTVGYLLGEAGEASIEAGTVRKTQASDDLETLIRDMATEHPDLIVLFRDTREHWEALTSKEKRAIADGMAFVLGRADAGVESRLRKVGRKGQI
jgi:transcriptional regulator with XRE-family HTH domain